MRGGERNCQRSVKVLRNQVDRAGEPRTDLSRHVDVSGHDAHLAASGVNDTRAVGSCRRRGAPESAPESQGKKERGTEDAPIIRDLDWALRASMTRISSSWGIPSVMVTMRPISASMASMMASAAAGGGT